MRNEIIIVGSRSTGLALGYYLKPNLAKKYYGRGFAYEKLQTNCNIITFSKIAKIELVKNLYRVNLREFKKTKSVFLTVRDPDINSTLRQLKNYLIDKHIYILTSTVTGFEEAKKILKGNILTQLILLNGINYLSPSLIHLVGSPQKINILTDDNNFKLINEEIYYLFRKDRINLINTDQQNYKYREVIFLRYAKTILSLLCLKYKTNIYGIVRHHFSEMRILLNELANLLDTEIPLTKNFINELKTDTNILGYYTSYYINKYLRFKTDCEWKYFIRDINELIISKKEAQNLLNFINMEF